MATLDSHSMEAGESQKAFTSQLKKVYGFYTGGFIGFLHPLLAIAEQMGLSGLLAMCSWAPPCCSMPASAS